MEGMLQLSPKDELIQKFGKFYSSKSPSTGEAAQARERFSEHGLTLERDITQKLHVIAYEGPNEEVFIPDDVVSVESYAFDGAIGIKRLRFLHGLKDIGIRAFAVGDQIDVIHIDLNEPIDGHTCFEIRFPRTERGKRQQYVALTSPNALELSNLYENYDVAIASSSGLDAATRDDDFDSYDQFKSMIERLKDPVFMTPVNKQLISRAIENRLIEACIALSAHGDRGALEDLADLGFLREDNITLVIDKVSTTKDAAMTAHLFELRHRWFEWNDDALDFSL